MVGAGATIVMDVAAEAIKRKTGVPPLDLRMVGRWVGHMAQGNFAHKHIGKADPIPREHAIGLAAHYGIGMGFVPFVMCIQKDWFERPTFLPALAVGLGTSLAPWLWMQPAFGFGVMGSKLPTRYRAFLHYPGAFLLWARDLPHRQGDEYESFHPTGLTS